MIYNNLYNRYYQLLEYTFSHLSATKHHGDVVKDFCGTNNEENHTFTEIPIGKSLTKSANVFSF